MVLQDPALPPGCSWLPGVRELTLPGDVAAANLAVLAQASSLTRLAVLRPDERSHGQGPGAESWLPAVLAFAECHAPLRRLDIEPTRAPRTQALAKDMANSAGIPDRPGLGVRFVNDLW